MTERKRRHRNRKNDHAVLVNKTSIQEQVYTLQQSGFTVSKRLITSQKDLQPAKKRLLETAEKRIRIDLGDTWAIQVKGRSIFMNDLVAEEALLHKRCNTNVSHGSSFNTDGAGGRKQDEFRLELFHEIRTWLETELEHSLFTLDQIHQKMISMDKSPEKSIVY